MRRRWRDCRWSSARDTGCFGFSAKRTSRLVRMPTQLARFLDDRDAADPVGLHQLQRFGQRLVGRHGDRVDDHPAFEALDRADRRRLLLDVRLRWRTPIPPSCASAIAMSASVTVSIADDSNGMLSGISRVRKRARVGLAGQHGGLRAAEAARRRRSGPAGCQEHRLRSAISAHAKDRRDSPRAR